MKCMPRCSLTALSCLSFFMLSCSGGGNGTHDHPVECRDLGDLVPDRPAGDWYVAVDGSDERDGRSYETAFATIQKGVDSLQPGQTLIIGPGEYFGAVFVDHLGSMEEDTTIRAEIPGTAVLRGDIPAPAFEKLDGYSRVYEADVEPDHGVQMANELDTLKVLSRAPSIDELDFTPGRFYQDKEARKLYLSSSDTRAVDLHRYTLSVTPTHGLYLDAPQRVVVEGLTVTGFNNLVGVDYSEQTLWATYGIFIRNGRSSVVRDCQAYLNGRGIGTSNEYDDTSGDNLIEGCKAWGNGGVGLAYDTGGIDLLYSRRDQVRSCEAFLNTANGISMRGGVENHVEADASFIRNSLSWGNTEYDFWIKMGENFNFYENSVAFGSTGNTDHLRRCVTGDGAVMGTDSIILGEEADLDLTKEFADPDNFDFHLQARSRFVGADAGADRGAFPYEENIFYVSPGGDDSADGLSADRAWQTLDRALRDLEAGDTLYIEPGIYTGSIEASLAGSEDEPIVIRGRGKEPSVIDGDFSLTDGRHVLFERIHFKADVSVSDCDAASFHNCVFMGRGTALTATNTANLRVTQSTFTGFETAAVDLPCCAAAHLAGNLFDNRGGPALRVSSRETVRYCDYNSYADMQHGWQLGENAVGTLEEIMLGHDRVSKEIIPQFSESGGSVTLDG
jgi:hypothetical protein